MLTELVDIIKNIALRHKGVRTFRYQDKLLNNAQNNYETYQVYVDDSAIHQINITTNIVRAEYQVYILSQPQQNGKSILEIQDEAYTIAVDIMAKLEIEYGGVMAVHDWSILTVSHLTDDDSAGVRLSLVLRMPSPLNYCTLDDNFNEEPYEPEQEQEIHVPTKEEGDITIKTIKLPKKNRC